MRLFKFLRKLKRQPAEWMPCCYLPVPLSWSRFSILYDLIVKNVFIYNRTNDWYNRFVTAPILVTGRGCQYGIINFLLSLYCGKCSRLLHKQMVGWRWQAVISLNRVARCNEQEPPVVATTGGSICVSMDTNFLLPIGIITYAGKACKYANFLSQGN